MLTNRSRAAVAAALLVSLAFVLSACGGGQSTVSPRAYARTVCGSVGAWQRHIRSRTDQMTASLGSDVSPQKGKEVLGTYLDGVIRETDQVIDDLNNTGVPDVKGGQTVASKFVGAFESVRTTLRNARSAVDRLPTGDRTAFKEAASKIGDDIQSSFSSVSSSLSGVGGPDLDAAFNAEKSCQA
jgi:hypothetical protein